MESIFTFCMGRISICSSLQVVALLQVLPNKLTADVLEQLRLSKQTLVSLFVVSQTFSLQCNHIVLCLKGWAWLEGRRFKADATWSFRGPWWDTTHMHNGMEKYNQAWNWRRGMLHSMGQTDCWRYAILFVFVNILPLALKLS